jgi:hypothetical protein
MTQIYDQAVPIVNLPFLYINGAQISNDATTPNTVLDIAAGQMRDSSNTYDMNLGNFNGQVNGSAPENVVTLLNAAVVGFNGIDTGALAASKVYHVYVISDPVSGNPSGTLLSLATSVVGPLMPFGYSAYRHIGWAVTDSSSHFLLGYNAGNDNARLFMYDAPISVGTTASSSSYATVDLTKFVPLVNNIPVIFNASISGTAADTLSLQPGNAVAASVVITAAVSSQALQQQVLVMAQNKLVSSVLSPTINYKNSGTDTIAIAVDGFWYFI